jgi:hypothetical protein
VSEKLTSAALFLASAASLGSAFVVLQQGFYLSYWTSPAQIAAKLSLFLLVFAAALILIRPRLGYRLGLAAGLSAVPWFVQTETSGAAGNGWVILNYESPPFSGDEGYRAFAGLKILSVALFVIAMVYALLRLLPNSPLQRRTWPAFAAGFLVLALWFGGSVTPYRVPGSHHGVAPDLRILHIEKRGLRFHETQVSVSRDGKVFTSRLDRRLFRYRSKGTTAQAETSPGALQQARALIHPPDLWKSHTPAPGPLRSWNAEGWYVVLNNTHLLAFTTESGTRPPEEVTQLFQLLESLPRREERPSAIRDVCLGFCYGPLAALGITRP